MRSPLRNATTSRRYPPQANGGVFDTLDVTTGWSAGAGSVATYNSWFTEGVGALRVTGPGANQAAFISKAIALQGPSIQNVTLDVNILSTLTYAQGQVVTVYLSADNFTSWLQCSAYAGSGLRQGVNRNVVFHKDQFTQGGIQATTWASAITHVRLRLDALSGVTSDAAFDNLRLNYKSPGAGVVVSADDIWADLYEQIWPACVARDIPLTVYCISDFIGQSGRCTLAQLQEMHDAGVMICNHGKTHLDLTAGPSNQADTEAEFSEYITFAQTNGWTRDDEHLHGAYRSGHYNSTSIAAMAALGMKSMRTTRGGFHPHHLEDTCYKLPELPADGTTIAASVAAFDAYLDQLEDSGGFADVNFHLWTDDTPSLDTQCNATVAAGILDSIVTRRAAGTLSTENVASVYAKKKTAL